MHHTGELLLALFIAYLAAQAGGELAQRLRLPAVVGEICAGVAVGPSALGWLKVDASLETLAELGVVLLMFSVGLETRLEDLRRVGGLALRVALAGVALPFALGYGYGASTGLALPETLYLAAALVATSAGITARVLKDLKVLDRTESRVILGAAIIDDVLAMLVLGAVAAFGVGGGVRPVEILLVLGEALGFVLVFSLAGTLAMRHSSDLIEKPIHPLSPLTLSLALCLGVAALATHFGLAAIIGAFLAGMAAAETRQQKLLEHQMQPILAFVTPFFFVVTGTHVDLKALASAEALTALAVVTVLAIAGKLAGCGLAAARLGRRSAWIVGTGMTPRGEVGVVVASLGLAAGVLSAQTYAVIIAMSLLTALLAPFALAALLRRGD